MRRGGREPRAIRNWDYLDEYFEKHPEREVAWDRDVPGDTRWRAFVKVYPFLDQPLAGDGHGTAYLWIADDDAELGGRWERMLPADDRGGTRIT